MDVPNQLTNIARRAAISAVAGLLVSAFAAAALALGTVASADRLTIGRTLSASLGPVLSAIVGAGLLASLVVFACLIANDVLRSVGPWLFARRCLLLGPFKVIAWLVAQIALAIVVALQFIARSTVVVEAVWLARTVGKAVLWVGTLVMLVGFGGIVYVGMIVIGFVSIRESTRMVVAMLDDPPPALMMAGGIGGALVVMYIGLVALAICGWFTYRLTRAGLQRAAARRLSAVV